MSDLNYDLFVRHILDSPACACGHYAETVEHYLLECPLYDGARIQTIGTLHSECIETDILLNGDVNISLEENNRIFHVVQSFVMRSCRFGTN